MKGDLINYSFLMYRLLSLKMVLMAMWLLVLYTAFIHVPLSEAQGINNPHIFVDSFQGEDTNECWYQGWDVPCLTLDYALEGVHKTSNSTRHPWIYLQNGTYELSCRDTQNKTQCVFDGLSGIADFGLLGNDTDSLGVHSPPPVVVNCVRDGNASTGLTFLNINTSITIEHVWFHGCGALQNSTSKNSTTDDTSSNEHTFFTFHAGLYFLLCKDLSLYHVWVTNSIGIGAVVYSTTGENSFSHCNFSVNKVPNDMKSIYPGGGGLYLEFSYCLPGDLSSCNNTNGKSDIPKEYVSNSTYHIFDCTFADNVATILNATATNNTFIIPHARDHVAFGRGGGLSVFFKGETQNNTIIVNMSRIIHNRALWGGGALVEFQDNSSSNVFHMHSTIIEHNKSPHNISRNEGTGGGGMRLGYIFYGYAHVHNNSMRFDDCSFNNNTAYWGGGVSFYVAREQGKASATNSLEFEHCNWTSNKARLGAAVDLSVWHPVSNGAVVQVKFTDTIISSHHYDQPTGSIVGIGAFYTDSVPAVFYGYANFAFNTFSAFAATSTSIDFFGSANFIANSGRNGGAITLFGYAFIRVHSGVSMTFIHNSAKLKGGAIYAELVGEHELISSRNCFIRYKEIEVHPDNWNATLTFTNNKAGGKPNSIFTSSILPCVWGGANGPAYVPNNNTKVFCWNKHWIYNDSTSNHYCSDQIETAAGVYSQSSYTMSIIPGDREGLPIQMTDDFNRSATDEMVLTASVDSDYRNISRLDNAWKYIPDNTIKLFGKPDESVLIDFYTVGPRVVYTQANVTLLPCPPGYYANSNDGDYADNCVCGNYHGFIRCLKDFQSRLEIKGTWIGYKNGSLVAGESPYTNTVNAILPKNPAFLNKQLCRDPSHRQGVLCGQCASGYAPSINSGSFECVKCTGTKAKLGWLLFIATKFIPLTIFFIILVVFNISLTSGPANAFIFYSQIITTCFGLYTFSIKYQKLKKSYVVPYDIWNLNFFDAVIPSYCLHPHMKVVTVIALDYLVAFYPLILIFVLYIGIKLNNRGIRPLACLCKPLHDYIVRFQQTWDLRRSITDVIAAFLLLSYTKFIIVSIQLLSPVNLYDHKNVPVETVLYIDGSVRYFHHEHIPYVLAALVILVVFVLCPPVLLLAYPKCGKDKTSGRIQVTTQNFLNTFYGCYKDGRDGTWDFRYFAGLYFIFRIVFFCVYYFIISSWSLQYALQQIMCTAGIFLFAVFRPYQNDFYNNVDTTMFVILALVNALSNYNYDLAENSKSSKIVFGFMYALIWCPLIYMLLFLFNHFCNVSSKCHNFWSHLTKRNQRQCNNNDNSFLHLLDNREDVDVQEEQGNRREACALQAAPERVSLLRPMVSNSSHSPSGEDQYGSIESPHDTGKPLTSIESHFATGKPLASIESPHDTGKPLTSIESQFATGKPLASIESHLATGKPLTNSTC